MSLRILVELSSLNDDHLSDNDAGGEEDEEHLKSLISQRVTDHSGTALLLLGNLFVILMHFPGNIID